MKVPEEKAPLTSMYTECSVISLILSCDVSFPKLVSKKLQDEYMHTLTHKYANTCPHCSHCALSIPTWRTRCEIALLRQKPARKSMKNCSAEDSYSHILLFLAWCSIPLSRGPRPSSMIIAQLECCQAANPPACLHIVHHSEGWSTSISDPPSPLPGTGL